MKKAFFIFTIFFYVTLLSQITYNDESFKEKIFNLKIIQKDYVSDKSFGKGAFIFGEATKNSLNEVGDYRNLAVALSYLKEDESLIKYAIDKAFSLNSEFMVELYKHLKKVKPVRYKRDLKWFPSIENKLLELNEEKTQTARSTLNSKCEKGMKLVELIQLVRGNDQKYRGQDYRKNLDKQTKLDSLNLSIIDSLYKKYNTYVGKSLVGEKLEHVMWLVIQHSNIQKMEEYLPIIANAAKNKELSPMILAMLLDRIYHIKYGYQIFGSQQGVELGNESIRKEVKSKYDLEGIGQ